MTPKSSLEAASATADELGHRVVTPGHVMLALLDQAGAAELLADLGVDPMAAREEARLDAETRNQPGPVDRAIREGDAVPVRLGQGLPIGDLGNARADARLLQAILLRDGPVARWLTRRGLNADTIEEAFPGSSW